MKAILLLTAFALAGGAETPRPAAPAEQITYELHNPPFCGECRSSTLVVTSDGRAWIKTGHWAGDYRDWRTVTRRWKLPPGQFERYRDALASHRPAANMLLAEEGCSSFSPDGGQLIVRWQGGGPDVWLSYEEGCADPGRIAIGEALSGMPALLGVRGGFPTTSVMLPPSRGS